MDCAGLSRFEAYPSEGHLPRYGIASGHFASMWFMAQLIRHYFGAQYSHIAKGSSNWG